MDKDMPIFFCPFRGPGTQFRSKNYIEYTLGIGINYYKFLGLEEPPMPSIAMPQARDKDIDIATITQIDNLANLVGASTYGPPPIEEVRDPSSIKQPLVTLTDQNGWIYEHDSSGDITKSTKRIRTEDIPIPMNDNDEIPTHSPEPHAITLTEAPNDPDINLGTMEHEITKNPRTIIGRGWWGWDDTVGPIRASISDYSDDAQTWIVSYDNMEDQAMNINSLRDELPTMKQQVDEGGKPTIDDVFTSIQDQLEEHPSKFIGVKFWKTFDGYEASQGAITKYFPKEVMWHAKYLDGDAEDLDTLDMVEVFENSASITEREGKRSKIETKRTYSCKEGENFFNVCDSIGLQVHLRRTYYAWLGDGYGQFGEEWDSSNPSRHGIYFNFPWGRGRKTIFRSGTKFPMPIGDSWNKVLSDLHAKDLQSNIHHETILATRLVQKDIITSEWLKDTFRKESPQGSTKSTLDITNKDTGKIIDPKDIADAMSRPDKGLWETAIRKELDALDGLGVLSHGHRLEDIKKMGITNSAVPMQLLYGVKYHPNGELDKYKVRDVVQGHKGYMRKGEHFYNTFSASPSCRTTRLLQALTIGT